MNRTSIVCTVLLVALNATCLLADMRPQEPPGLAHRVDCSSSFFLRPDSSHKLT